MKQSHQCVAMAGLLAVMLAITGCAVKGGADDTITEATGRRIDAAAASNDVAGIVTTSADLPAGSGAAGGTGSNGATGMGVDSSAGMQAERGDRPTTPSATIPTPNATVLAIVMLPATGSLVAGEASMGSSGVTGASGSAAPTQAYRITVRMDDGSTQVIPYTDTPEFRSGERINVTGGAIRR